MIDLGTFPPIEGPAPGPVSAQFRRGRIAGCYLPAGVGTVHIGSGEPKIPPGLHSQYCYPSPCCRPDPFPDRSAILSQAAQPRCAGFRQSLARGRARRGFSFETCRALAHAHSVNVLKQRGTRLCAVLSYWSHSSRFSVFRDACKTIFSAALPALRSALSPLMQQGSAPLPAPQLAAQLARPATNTQRPAVKRPAFGRKQQLKRRVCHQAPAAFLYLKDAC